MARLTSLQRERITLALADGREIDVERVRDPRARRIKLLVSERGVRLTVPRSASLREAHAFLGDHRDWLAEQLCRWQSDAVPAPLQRGVTAALPLRGGRLDLEWRDGRYANLDVQADRVTLQLPEAAPLRSAQRLLHDFYLAQARADAGRWLAQQLPFLPRSPRRLRLRPLRSLWGSLSPDDAVSLDLSLILGPPAAFQYVLVHELCHLLQRNHGPAFWREVEHRFPDWRAQRAFLRGDGMALKATLDGLLGRARRRPDVAGA